MNVSACKYKSDEDFKSKEMEVAHEETEILPKDRELALEALKLLSHLDDNWNGYGTIKPSPASIENASNFITKIPLPFKAPNKLYSDDEGHIVLICVEEGSRLIITVEPLVLHFSYEKNRYKPIFKDDVFFDGVSIPKEIKEYLSKR